MKKSRFILFLLSLLFVSLIFVPFFDQIPIEADEVYGKVLPFTSEMYCDQNASPMLQYAGCGNCATSMMFKYYGFDISGEEVANDIGLRASLDLCLSYISGTEICANIENELSYRTDNQLYGIGASGGNIDLIKQEIDTNRPVMAILDAGLLWNIDRYELQGHYILITGFAENGDIIYQDSSRGMNHSISQSEFLEAWNTEYGDFANPYSYLVVRENGITPPMGDYQGPEKPKRIGLVRNSGTSPFLNEDLRPLLSALDYEYELIPALSVPSSEIGKSSTYLDYLPDKYDVIYLPENEVSIYYLSAIRVNYLNNGGKSLADYIKEGKTVIGSGSFVFRMLNGPLGIEGAFGEQSIDVTEVFGSKVDLKIMDSGFRDFVDPSHQTKYLTMDNFFGEGELEIVDFGTSSMHNYLVYEYTDQNGLADFVPIMFGANYYYGELVVSMLPLSSQNNANFLAYTTSIAVSSELRNLAYTSTTLSNVPTSSFTTLSDVGGGTGLFRHIINEMKDKLEFIFAWWGSSIEVSIYRPDGSLYQTVKGSNPPLSVIVHNAEAGEWTYEIRVLEADQLTNYPVAVSVYEGETVILPSFEVEFLETRDLKNGDNEIVFSYPRPLYLKFRLKNDEGEYEWVEDFKVKIKETSYEFELSQEKKNMKEKNYQDEPSYKLMVYTDRKMMEEYGLEEDKNFTLEFIVEGQVVLEKEVIWESISKRK